jgi:hypothetical protein
MTSEIEILDFDDALVIMAKQRASRAEAVLSAVVVGVFGGIALFRFLTMPLVIATAVLAAVLRFLFAVRKRTAELRVTNLEFRSRGRVGDNFGSMRSASRADVKWLEYQEDTSGPETSHHPGGLYAVLGTRSICLLPNIDEQQASLVIERILYRFPELRDLWRRHSPFGEHFTTLGLDRPSQ